MAQAQYVDGSDAPKPSESMSPVQRRIGVGVLLGWFAVPTLVVVRWVNQHSDVVPTDDECSWWCFSERQGAAIVAFMIGAPAGVLGLSIAAIVFSRLIRDVRSGLVAGTVAGVAGLVLGLAVVYGAWSLWANARTSP